MKKEPAGTARGLAAVETWDTNSPTVAAIELHASNGASSAYAVDASSLASVVEALLIRATEPVFAAASLLADAQVPRVSADATRIEWKSGRSPTECAATIRVGCVDLVLFLPLDDVVRATATLVAHIERPGTPPDLH